MKNLKKNQKGFTIIEVMFVLVIAAAILLIVFLAVPALQRTSRNTNRKADVGRIGAAATEYLSNKNGTSLTASNGATLNSDAQLVGATFGTLAYYTFNPASNFIIETSGVVAATTITDKEQVRIVTGAQCDTAVGAPMGKISATGSPRQMAIQYATESGSGQQAQCQNI